MLQSCRASPLRPLSANAPKLAGNLHHVPNEDDSTAQPRAGSGAVRPGRRTASRSRHDLVFLRSAYRRARRSLTFQDRARRERHGDRHARIHARTFKDFVEPIYRLRILRPENQLPEPWFENYGASAIRPSRSIRLLPTEPTSRRNPAGSCMFGPTKLRDGWSEMMHPIAWPGKSDWRNGCKPN
jgi:hypothetical protein